MGDKFIIQNFRSWKDKNYLELNDLTFLFGANSSGKSSLLNALGLIQQSILEEKRSIAFVDRVFDKLIPNGPNVKLGKISGQNFRRIKTLGDFEAEYSEIEKSLNKKNKKTKLDKSHTSTDQQLGFGWSWTKHPAFFQETRKDQFGAAILDQFENKIELMFYFDTKTGENIGVEYRLGNHSVFKITKEITYDWDDLVDKKLDPKIESVKFRVQCSQDGTFWDKIFSSYSRLGTTMAEYLRSEIKNYMKDFKENLLYDGEAYDLFEKLRSLQHEYRLQKSFSREITDKLRRKKFIGQREELLNNLNEVEKTIIELEKSILEMGFTPRTTQREFSQKINLQTNKPFMERISGWGNFENFLNDIRKMGSFEVEHKTINAKDDHGMQLKNFTVLEFLTVIQGRGARQRYFRGDSDERFNLSEQTRLLEAIANLFGTKLLNFPRMTQNLTRRFRMQMDSIHQIGPIRQQPERFQQINMDKSVHNVGYSGENLMNVLHNLEPSNRDKINSWLKRLEIGYRVDTKFTPEFNIQELILTDENHLKVAINDVGFGVTQVLPIVVEAVLAENKLITIEQPELHIHPKLQSNLADLFLWSSTQNHNSFLIETHSEHIILRLQKRQRDGELPAELTERSGHRGVNDLVTINVIEKLGEPPQSQIEVLGINSKGGFKGEWPGGFFTERFSEKGLM